MAVSFRTVVVLLTLAAAPLLVSTIPTASALTTSRVVTITNASAKPTVAFQGFDGNPPKFFDFNNDGQKEIIAQNDNQWVYVFDSKTGAILAQMRTTLPAGWGARSFNGPEATIMTNGAKPRLVIENSAAVVTSFEFDPTTTTPGHFGFKKLWERRLNDCFSNPGADSKPTLVDLDKDGTLEIVAGTEELGVYALRANGALYWKNCLGGGNADQTIGDLNRDGWPDVVHVSDGGVISALNGRTGGWMWPAFNALSKFQLGSASMPVGAAIGQIDGVGGPDIVVGARDSHDATNFSRDHAMLIAVSSTGTLLWGKQYSKANPLTYTHPIIVDADKDGKNEIYWADWNTMGHKPPWDESLAWQRTGPGHFFRYERDGTLKWVQTLDTYWSNKDLALADVDADGVQEVLANGPGAGGDGIWYLNSNTGAKETFVCTCSSTTQWDVAREPIIGDLWKTGTMQWIVEVGGAGGNGILVYDTHAPYNSLWPHLPYVTKSHVASTTSPTPTTSTTVTPFTASFTPKQVGNDYWVEVDVTANKPLSRVDAIVTSGTTTTTYQLSQQTWGSWAKGDIFVPNGSIVKFKATATTGQTVTSGPVTWT